MRVAQLFAGVLVLGLARGGPVLVTPQDLGDLAAVIPLDRVWEVVGDYLAYDEDVRNLVGYIHTEDFRRIITKVDALPEFTEFMNSLEASGYEAHKYWNIIHTVMGLPAPQITRKAVQPPLKGGVTGLVQDVRALLQEDDIKRVYEEKLKTNPRYQMLVDLFNGIGFKNVLQKVADLPEVTSLLSQVGDLKFD